MADDEGATLFARHSDITSLELAYLRSHEIHMRHIYGLRWAGLGLAALTIVIGAVMMFYGLQGSFDWAVEAPHTVGAKLTNASPGIVFVTVGMIIAFVVVVQKPVNYWIGGDPRIHELSSLTTPKHRVGGAGMGLFHRWRP